jgi:hypothetical protein
MFDLIYGIMFLLLSTTSIISIIVVVLYLSNRTKKQEVKSNEAEKSIKKLNERQIHYETKCKTKETTRRTSKK